MLRVYARYGLAVIGLVVGFYGGLDWLGLLSEISPQRFSGLEFVGIVALISLLGGLVAYALTPALFDALAQSLRWLESHLVRLSAQEVIGGALGVIIGLIIAFLLGLAFSRIPAVGNYIPALISILMGYLGWRVAVRKREDWFGSLLPFLRRPREEQTAVSGLKVLDTSVIIDGRILDLCKTGFIEGVLVVPAFVLDELRHIADSSDPLKRQRGRRGLDILNALQKEPHIQIEVREFNGEGLHDEVDVRLIQLARSLGAKVVTNDYNLNKVAQFQGVTVLNVNELANALKPAMLPGEDLTVHVLRDGKEPGQGVAFLDDGTMIVIDGGKRYIGEQVAVEVTSVIQTNAGRMIFAKVRGVLPEARSV